MTPATPTVSVIVPHFDDVERLDRCLSALSRQDFPADRFEIIVADNNSPQGRAAIECVVAGRARLVVVPEKGAGAARNGGAAIAAGELFAFTDSDCLPQSDWLTQGVAALARFDLVGGRMVVLVEDQTDITSAEAFERVFAFANHDYVTHKGFTVSANLFCPRSVFEDVGGFATTVLSEDMEWCQRATAKGYRLGYASSSVVGHPARRTWADLVKKARRIDAELFGLARLRRGGKLRWLLRTLLLPVSAVVHTPKAMAGGGLRTFRQRLGAIAVLYRLRLWRTADSLRLFLADP